jgi:hypothetical protein
MYYIVEITSQGIETFLAGFEDIGAAWDVVSGLQCEARRQRRKASCSGCMPCRSIDFGSSHACKADPALRRKPSR